MYKINKIILMLFSFFLTAFIFLNSYEIAFNKDIPYIQSVEKVEMSGISNSYKISAGVGDNTFSTKKFGTLKTFSLSDKYRIQLVPALEESGSYLARANAGHYSSLQLSNSFDNVFIYMRQGTRTIDSIATINMGDNIAIGTSESWRFLFRVENVDQYIGSSNFVIQDDGKQKLIVLLQDAATNTNSIITAKYIITEKTGNE